MPPPGHPVYALPLPKTGNIFVALDGCLKLGDLGLSRYFSSRTLQVVVGWLLVVLVWEAAAILEGTECLCDALYPLPLPQAVSQVGTPYYMSPGVGILDPVSETPFLRSSNHVIVIVGNHSLDMPSLIGMHERTSQITQSHRVHTPTPSSTKVNLNSTLHI